MGIWEIYVVENAVLTLLHSGYYSGLTEIKSNTQYNLWYRISELRNLSTKKMGTN